MFVHRLHLGAAFHYAHLELGDDDPGAVFFFSPLEMNFLAFAFGLWRRWLCISLPFDAGQKQWIAELVATTL